MRPAHDNNFAVAITTCLAGTLLIPLASAATKAEFCQNLSSLEQHMTKSLMAERHSTYTTSFECACGDVSPADGSFVIDCKIEAGDPARDGNTTFSTTEKMVFELRPSGVYELATSSWGWDSESVTWPNQEAYFLKNGRVESCKANGCRSCTVCNHNRKFVAVDCSNMALQGYRIGCDAGYVGAYANSYHFGEITGEPLDGEISTTDPSIWAHGSYDYEAFCEDLSHLESHMTRKFEKKMGKMYTSNFECECDALDTGRDSFTVACFMEGTEGGKPFVASEQMMLKGHGGHYELTETSWGWDHGEAELPNQGSFYFEDGKVSCQAKGCDSCAVCNNGKSIAVDCGDSTEEE